MTEDWTPPLPPRRELPDAVRARLRARVLGPDHRAPSWLGSGTPLAVAAAVALLVACAAVLMPIGRTVQPGAGVSLRQEESPLDRCWAAVVAAGRTADYPPRASWRIGARFGEVAPIVVAIRTSGRPVLCETTLTAVTVSDPTAPDPGGDGAPLALLATSAGSLGGVVGSRWAAMTVRTADQAPVRPFAVVDGVWLVPTPVARARELPSAQLIGPRREASTTPPVTQDEPVSVLGPGVAVVDRPAATGQRTSPEGRFLGTCIAQSTRPVPDPLSWTAGAMTPSTGDTLVLARSGTALAECAARERDGRSTYEFRVVSPSVVHDRPVRYLRTYRCREGTWVVGVVRGVYATMTVGPPGGGTATEVPLSGGTFALRISDETGDGGPGTLPRGLRVRLLGALEGPYEGELAAS
ncbi:hypothetical protein [Actinokineospora sp. NBRC 105648]|uniref:hypothetical protein n=1 Tax=Actinokineospora sp. NBRC 105648 TaxID=3032206 RepID=UPI0024A298BA|nr:hypothetical protein [Actinokineospora sp. NBRC 105648]GLZ43148.1 hypothetical protein Acsp05_67720 [Actinokineospora sp. NBRC 105648]